MRGSADIIIDLPLAPIPTHIISHSALSPRLTPTLCIGPGLAGSDPAITPRAPAGRRRSWTASTGSLGSEGQRKLSESLSSSHLLVALGTARWKSFCTA